MKKKASGVFILIISIFLVLIAINVVATPDSDDSSHSCHTNPGGKIISVKLISPSIEDDPTIINVTTGTTSILLNITATGAVGNLKIYIPTQSGMGDLHDNEQLIFSPSSVAGSGIAVGITDDDGTYDQDAAAGSMLITINVTLPAVESGYYYLFILAATTSGETSFASARIGISIGGAAAPPPPPLDWWNHLGNWLGLPALILLTASTVLVLYNENKFVKIHGIAAGASWILTLTNIIALIRIPIAGWGSFGIIIHLPHIIFGGLGLFTGFFSMLFGIAAERKYALATGYVTLISWWGAFLSGLLLVL